MMIDNKNLESMAEDIQNMRRIAEHLRETGTGIESLKQPAGHHMLEGAQN